MPILKGAKKALRQSKKRARVNLLRKKALQSAVKKLKKEKKANVLTEVYRLADKAAKIGVIHKNKAARIKRAASKLVPAQAIKKSAPKTKTSK